MLRPWQLLEFSKHSKTDQKLHRWAKLHSHCHFTFWCRFLMGLKTQLSTKYRCETCINRWPDKIYSDKIYSDAILSKYVQVLHQIDVIIGLKYNSSWPIKGHQSFLLYNPPYPSRLPISVWLLHNESINYQIDHILMPDRPKSQSKFIIWPRPFSFWKVDVIFVQDGLTKCRDIFRVYFVRIYFVTLPY